MKISKIKKYLQEWLTVARILGLLFFSFGLAGVINGSISYPPIQKLLNFYKTISPELFGIGITVLIIDWANEHHLKRLEKDRLIREINSLDIGIAHRALREFDVKGWLKDGTLNKADLSRANLSYASLNGANLENTNLTKANLKEAILDGANLQNAILDEASFESANMVGANLQSASVYKTNFDNATLSWTNLKKIKLWNEEQLSKSCMLWGATMPDNTIYDGRYDLKGDIEEAFSMNINYQDPKERKEFYTSMNKPFMGKK